MLPSGAAHAVTISFTSTAEAPVRYFDGSATYLDVSFAGKPSGPGGPCPVFCTASLTENVQTSAYTNTQMWSVGPIPPATLNETQSLSYDLSITMSGTTVTETITHSMNVDFHSYNDAIFMNVLGGPVTTFDFGVLGKIDVWVNAQLFAITQMHNGSGVQFRTQMLLHDVGEVTQVPEPASAGLVASGLVLAAALRRRRRQMA
jgi:hypothetical protein